MIILLLAVIYILMCALLLLLSKCARLPLCILLCNVCLIEGRRVALCIIYHDAVETTTYSFSCVILNKTYAIE